MSLSRREFFGAAAVAAASAAQISCGRGVPNLPNLSVGPLIGRAVPSAERDLGQVKITDVKTASIKLG